MKTKYILVTLFLGLQLTVWSQKTLSDYSYVVVPEQFEFLNEKDKYQLNSISNFLFNKHGFHSFMSHEIPEAKRCDGLYADLERGKAFLRTKFSIILRDCDGNEVYRSPQGVSKFKEFKKAYQDALRRAFLHIEELDVQQKEIIYFESKEAELEESNTSVIKPVETVNSEKLNKSEMNETEIVLSSPPQSKFSNYSYGGNSYLLRKTSSGYLLYEEDTTTEDGLLLVATIELQKGSKILFIETSGNIFKGSFDDMQNMVIQRSEGNEVYRLVR